MAEYISKITLPNGVTYEVKDLGARQLIQDIASAGISFVISTSAGDTPLGVQWRVGDTLITGTLAPSKAATAIYLVPATLTSAKDVYMEYVCVLSGETYIWEKLGDTDVDISSLGGLAYKNEVSGTVSVIDSVSGTFNGNAVSSTGKYTPTGNVSATFSGADLSLSTSLTPSGYVTSTLGDDATAEVNISYTPAGTITKPAVTVSAPKTAAGASKLATAGSVTAGTAPSFTEGTFTAGSFTQGKDTFVAPTLTTSVEGETLTIAFTAGSFTQGFDTYRSASKAKDTFNAGSQTVVTLPTFTDVAVISGVTAALASAPTFNGAAATLNASAAVSGTINSTFTGTAQTISLSGKPAGTISAEFAGVQGDINVSGTTAGSVSITTSSVTKTITSK